jgi:hypothetical protein
LFEDGLIAEVNREEESLKAGEKDLLIRISYL